MAGPDATLVHAAVEVYLPSCVVRGDLITPHQRLSDHFLLRSGDEMFPVNNASVVDAGGRVLPFGEKQHFIQLHEVLFVVDRHAGPVGSSTNLDHPRVAKESKKAWLLVGPYWIRGKVHTLPGGEIQDLLKLKGRFIPVTAAVLVESQGFTPATLLVNRLRIACMAAAD